VDVALRFGVPVSVTECKGDYECQCACGCDWV